MTKDGRILVLCIDRDDDLGVYTKIPGPVIGKKDVTHAAVELAVRRPRDTDVNSMFATVKKAEEIRKHAEKVEIAIITGDEALGFKADKEINRQLDAVLDEFDADGVVLITDGAEDDAVIPLIQSKIPIISKELIIVRQAKELEKTYYVIKEAIKDPTIGKLALGLPGIILLLYFWIGFTSIRYMLMLVGTYLILKGFGIEDWAISGTKNFIQTISLQRLSFPFYVATIVFIVFLGIAFYGNYVNESNLSLVPQLAKTMQKSIGFLALAGATFVLGKIVDAHYLFKAFKLRTYTIIFVSTFILWYILDAGLGIILGLYTLGDLLVTVVLSATAFIITMRVTKIFEVKLNLDKNLLGQEVYNTKGQKIGEVTKIEKKRNSVFVKPNKGRGYFLTASNLSPRADGLVKLA